jgi:2-polyprenyl-6-methoxyphenol hydroxylase-like FAD-dependent oxidoreductase
MNIAIVGTGYVGLVSGTCFADTGANVTCVDVDANKLHGQKNVYIAVTSGSDVYLDAWQATEALPDAIDAISGSKIVKSESYDLSGRRLPDAHQHRGIVIEQYTDEKGVKHSRKRR